ncbi:hypothetical protein CL653_03540 [bacterium]|nr:hypothetical protein [bacterium]
MADLVVTVPKNQWLDWIEEGDAAGDPATGIEWAFFIGGKKPNILPGERLYIVAWGRLRGYSPIDRVERQGDKWAICRYGDAVAVTIDQHIKGFQGWRYRWWEYEDEFPFEKWKTEGLYQ